MRIINIYTLCVVLFAFLLQSCSEMNEPVDRFLDEGEIIYAAKVDSVAPRTGKNRIQLEISILSQRIEFVRILWNDLQDSVDIEIGNKTGVFSTVLNEMEEKNYLFQLVSYDEFGNKSLPVEATGKVYGAVYESKLVSRSGKIVSSVNGLVVNFSSAPDGNVATEVNYMNSSGEATTVSVPATENSYVITDSNLDSEFAFSSTYSAEHGIDLFYSSSYSLSGPFKFDVNDLSIVDYSTTHGGGENNVSNIISGDEGVRWHSQAGGSSYPHYATIDMGGERTISKLGIWRSIFDGGGDNRAPDEIQLFISMDNENWTDIGLGVTPFNRLINGEQFFELPTRVQARYLKFVAVSGPENNMVLGGINIYGY